jgi:putative ATP-binding cassette transporter
LTERVLKLYFRNKVYYALERKTGGAANVDYYDAAANKKATVVDNPDQRIQEDINTFTNYSLAFFSIAVESAVDLISFSIILGKICSCICYLD